MGVFDHHDRCVDHRADGDGDAAERHDVRIEALVMHDQERDQNPHREGEDRHEGAADMQQEKDGHQRDDEALLEKLSFQIVDSALDEVAAVVDGLDGYSFRQSRLQFLQFRFDGVDRREGVFSVAHDDDPADGFAFAVQVHQAAAQLGPQVYMGDVPDQDGRAVLVHPDGRVLYVLDGLDVAQTSHHELGLAHLDQSAAHVVVAALQGRAYFRQGNVVGQQLVGIDLDLVLLDVTADGSHFGHPGHAHQLIAQKPVLDGAQLLKVVPVSAVDHIFEGPADAGGVRSQGGRHAAGKPIRHIVEILQDPAAGPVHVGAVFEDDVDERVAEERIAAHGFRKGHPQHGRRERIRDLVFDDLRGLARIFGEDDHLHVAQVGDGVYGRAEHCIDPGQSDQEGEDDHQQAVIDRGLYDLFQHDFLCKRSGNKESGMGPDSMRTIHFRIRFVGRCGYHFRDGSRLSAGRLCVRLRPLLQHFPDNLLQAAFAIQHELG